MSKKEIVFLYKLVCECCGSNVELVTAKHNGKENIYCIECFHQFDDEILLEQLED